MDLSALLSGVTAAVAGGAVAGGVAKWLLVREISRLDEVQASIQQAALDMATIKAHVSEQSNGISAVKGDVKELVVVVALQGKDVAVLKKDVDHGFEMIRDLQGQQRGSKKYGSDNN